MGARSFGAEARRNGFHTLLARVAEGSDASRHLNESFGFVEVGTLKEVGRKFGRRLDLHLLQLMLNEEWTARCHSFLTRCNVRLALRESAKNILLWNDWSASRTIGLTNDKIRYSHKL